MSFKDGKIPPGTNLVQLIYSPVAEKLEAWCTQCDTLIGYPEMLNEAIKMWTDHQEAYSNVKANRSRY